MPDYNYGIFKCKLSTMQNQMYVFVSNAILCVLTRWRKNSSHRKYNFPIMPRSQVKRQDFNETMIISMIDNYLKFLHPIQQQENPIREELYYVLCSKTRNSRSQRQGT